MMWREGGDRASDSLFAFSAVAIHWANGCQWHMYSVVKSFCQQSHKPTVRKSVQNQPLHAIYVRAAAALGGARGETCPEPTIVPSYYTTADAVISLESVFVVEIMLTCRDGAQNVTLYADVNGKQFPITRGQDVGRYQVS
ncbi:hypothetical protein KIL84_008049 [Mauremys mutica]|uniref:Translocon-associated protein subunit delta n=1 Tax=Mauremys mutica TaxID=74926 RepID=A0A9D3X317_9SAUR|nr:hypothetical protein KIL84_008049 [Mauremys mutica]